MVGRASSTVIAKPQSLWLKRPRILSPLLAPANSFSSSSSSSMAHAIDRPVEEETLPGDRLRYFHQTHPGEVLDGRFKTIVKLGYGTSSTVWLAENIKFKWWKKSTVPRYVSIKIAASDIHATREATINAQLLSSNTEPSHDGFAFTRTPVDEFQLQGPEGAHSCLVYKPMRETLFQLQRRMLSQKFVLPLFQFYTYCLLEALDYLHTRCHIIHTDIKEDNVLVGFEDDAVLADFVKYHKRNPSPRHVRAEDGRITYLSQSDFGPLRGLRLMPVLADFNLAFPGLGEHHGHISAIQSHYFRAPEVLLGCSWSYSVDIWNVGLLMWNLLEDINLFGRPAGEDGEYDAHVHLAQMVSLLGDPPEELITRERLFRKEELRTPILNHRGNKTCKSMNEYWGGPFFDDDSQIFRRDLVIDEKKLADTVTELDGDEKAKFLDLASGMLQWLPEKRKTARELTRHPFFESINKTRAKYRQDPL